MGKRDKVNKNKILALLLTFAMGTSSVLPYGTSVHACEPTTQLEVTKSTIENLALKRTARASKSLEAVGENPARLPDLAFDGIASNEGDKNNSRWQSGDDATFSEQWLEVDLGGTCVISQVNVCFFARLYGSFVIEVSESNSDDAVWETIGSQEIASGTELDLVKEVDVRKAGKAIEIPRYLRFRFTSGNENAASRSIGVRELEVMGTRKSESGFETITGNIALNKKATASGVEAQMPQLTPNLAVDGDDQSDQSRWSSEKMKDGKDPNQKQTEQWLEIDLRNEVTDITSIDVSFFKLVYATSYEIQTRPNQDADWVTVETITNPVGNEQNLSNTIKTVDHLDRYVRFVFKTLNTNAGGNCVSVREIKIHGAQEQTPEVSNPGPENAKEAMDAVKNLEAISLDMTSVPLPTMPEGYRIYVKGSEYPQVISDDGIISEHAIYDYDMDIIVEVENEKDPTDKAEKSFQVHVPNKKALHQDLYPSFSKQNKEPQVIPSIQEWYGYQGDVVIAPTTTIIVDDGASVGIQKVATQLKEDLKEITGYDLAIETSKVSDDNDILLTTTTEDTYDTLKDGYFIQANDQGIQIESSTYEGVFNGTRTLAQVFYRQKGTFSFPKGVARDFSQYEVRGIMIDIARTPYRIEALEDILKTLSFYKINEVHFHLNDNRHTAKAGDRSSYDYWKDVPAMFRLESKTFPSLTTDGKDNAYYNEVYGGEPQYSQEEYIALQKLAMDYGMNPISEIDAPGHSLLFTRYVRNHLDEVQKVLPQIEGNIQSDREWELLSVKGKSGEWALDFLNELYKEYLNPETPVFLGDTVDIGVDEYWNIQRDEVDGIHQYMREMSKTVKESGKKVRMWGSLLQYCDKYQIDPKQYNDIEIDFWTNAWDNIGKRSKEGFKVVNVDSFHMYGNPGRDKRDIVNVEHLFNNWDPAVASSGNMSKADPNLMGAKTALWADISDMGVTERDNYERIVRQAAILSEKTWGGTDDSQTFEEYSFKFESLHTGPGVALSSNIPSKTDLVLHYDLKNTKDNMVYDLSGNGYHASLKDGQMTTSLRAVDYPYTVQFSVEPKNNTILFDGADGRLSINDKGKLQINRSYFTQTFDYTLPKGKAVDIAIAGTPQVTKLYINGALQDVLSRISKAEDDYDHLLSTFVFPLTAIDGRVDKLKVYDKALNPQTLDAISKNNIIQTVNVAQDKAAAGVAQRKGDRNYDVDWKKLRVGWKAIDGDGFTLDGCNSTDVTEKDSYFEGAYEDNSFAVDLYQVHRLSKVILQWDRAPKQFKLQTSSNGVTWKDVATYQGEKINTITFEKPLQTRYIKMQGVQNNNGTFKLREFEAYENTDKEALTTILKQAEAKIKKFELTYQNDKGYTEFYKAYLEAQSLLDNAMALQDAIDQGTKHLETLYHELPESLVDRKALEEALSLAGSIDRNLYTEESLAGLDKAVENAKALTDEATQKEVDACAKAIHDAINALVTVDPEVEIDTSKLADLVKKAKAIKQDGYTVESFNQLKDAIESAEALLKNEQATQAQVDLAYQVLEAAIEGLVPQPEAQEKPATGDNTPMMMYIAMMGLASIALISMKKKKVNQ